MSNKGEAKKILNFSISTWVNFLLGFISSFILTRIFIPEVLGTINLFYSTVATLLSCVCLGLDSGFIRFFNEPPKGESIPQFAFKLISIGIVFTVTFGFFSYAILGNDITEFFLGKRDTILFICILLGVVDQIFLRFLNIIYRMRMDIRHYNIQSIMIEIVTRFSVIIGALIDNSSALCPILVNVLCLSLVLLFYLNAQKKDWIPRNLNLDYGDYEKVVKFSLYIVLAGILINIYTLSSQLILKQKLGIDAVGIYSSAAIFISVLGAVKGGFGSYWSAFMYANYSKEEKQLFILQIHRVVLFASIVFCCFLFPLRRVAYLFIGEHFRGSMLFFSLVIMYPLLQTVQETTGYGIMIKNKTYITTIVSLLTFSINVFLGLVLVQRCGIIGMAWANFCSAIISFITTTIIAQKFYRSIPNFQESLFSLILLLSLSIMTVYFQGDIQLAIACAIVLCISMITYKDLMCGFLEFVFKKSKIK